MKPLINYALQLGFHAGFFRLPRLVRRGRAMILTFHRFSGNGEGHVGGLPIQRFIECIEYLTRNYRVVSLGDMLEELRRGRVSPYTTVLTVDDGYHEVFSLVAPVLRRYGATASIFVINEFIDGRLWPWTDRFRFVFDHAPLGRVTVKHRALMQVLEIRSEKDRQQLGEQWREYAKQVPAAQQEDLLEAIAEAWGVKIPDVPPGEYRSMTWAQLRALAAEGFDVGAHTRTHPILSRVSPEQLWDEIGGCKEEIERNLGFPVRHFAYPNGRREDYTPEAVEMVTRADYSAALTMVPGWNTPSTSPFELRRIGGGARDLAHFAQCVSGFDLLKLQVRG